MNSETFLPCLFELLAKSVLILGAAAFVDRAWFRASAAQRHLVWCAALGTLLLLPVTRCFEPRWSVPLQRVTVEVPPPIPRDLPPIVWDSSVAAAPAAVPVRRWEWPDWKQMALAGWMAGAGLLLAGRLLGSARLARLRRTMRPLADARMERMATEIFRDLGIRRRIALRVSPVGCVPLTWGTLRPVLTLPAEASQWSDGPLAAALRHEAGHIARYDHLTRWLAQFACILYWPNPLVWIAARRFRAAQEEATDDLVLRGGTAPDEYAAQLFEVARALATRHRLARHAIAMASPSTLERRMLAIVDERRARAPLSRRAIFSSALVVAMTLGVSTGVQVQGQEKKAAEENAPATGHGVQQVEVAAKFVELSEEAAAKLLPFFHESGTPGPASGMIALAGVLTDAQYTEVIRGLNQTRGVDLLSTPRVTTKSGQRAQVEIVREVRYATEYEKDGAGWKPKTFETRNTGVSFTVEPAVGKDGYTIDLNLEPSVVDLLGWIDQDNGAKYQGEAPAGRRVQPVFSNRKVTTVVSIWDGQTVVLGTVGRPEQNKDFPSKGPTRRLAIFVSAKIVTPEPRKTSIAAPPAPAAAPDPAPEIVIPKIEFREATLSEAIEFLRVKARAAGGNAVNIVVPKPPVPEPVMSLSLTNVPLPEAMRYVASLAGLTVRREANAYVLEALPRPASAAPAEPVISLTQQKARSIVLPKVEFRDATLAEAIDFLRTRSAALDPETDAAKKGVNIVLRDPSATASGARITISLTNVPLFEALHYVAELAGLELAVEPFALILRTPKKSAEAKSTVASRIAATEQQAQAAQAQLAELAAKSDALQAQVARLQTELKTKVAERQAAGGAALNVDARGDLFLGAYQAFQKAEKLEVESKFSEAQIAIRQCLEGLDELTKLDPNWNPAVVAYRKKRAQTAEERLRAK